MLKADYFGNYCLWNCTRK